jgi:signal transduction histidine kinase
VSPESRMEEKKPVNILMVDDQPGKLLSYETILAELGENLIRASSGNQALEQLLRKEIAVVLVDVVMPEMDGFELASMIRAHPRFQRTAIILVSSVMTEDIHRLKGYDSGAVDYVSVPIVPEILRAKVAIFCDLHRKTEALACLNQELEQRVLERTAEIQNLLKQTEDARVEAEKANQLKDEFLAILSHELRTPLNAISGWAHMLLAGGLDEATQIKAVETINRNALLQAQLISDLLDVSRIVSGKLSLQTKPVDMALVIQTAIDGIRPAAETKNVQIEAVLAPEVGLLLGDPARLQQVAGNLLSNAVKFTPSNGHVLISLNKSGADIELTVQDDGPGIPQKFMPHIFEPFRQADAAMSRSQKGLGLGLSIVRHLVELHGGKVQAMNCEDGPGAILKVVLPVPAPIAALAALLQCDADSLDDSDRVTTWASLKGTRVLVVDDEPDAREVASLILERCGAKVKLAASAKQAFDILERELPDVLIADIEMPGEDGYSLLRRIRNLPSEKGGQTPAVALTAYAGAQDRAKLLNAGFQRHLPKPVHPSELISVVATLAQSPMLNATPGV